MKKIYLKYSKKINYKFTFWALSVSTQHFDWRCVCPTVSSSPRVPKNKQGEYRKKRKEREEKKGGRGRQKHSYFANFALKSLDHPRF
jgi:hypothetical protein